MAEIDEFIASFEKKKKGGGGGDEKDTSDRRNLSGDSGLNEGGATTPELKEKNYLTDLFFGKIAQNWNQGFLGRLEVRTRKKQPAIWCPQKVV